MGVPLTKIGSPDFPSKQGHIERDQQPPILMENGNCIAGALGRLIDGADAVANLIKSLATHGSDMGETMSLRSRTYKQCMEFYKNTIIPVSKLDLSGTHSKWLIHCEKNGSPHCLALQVVENNTCFVWDGDMKMTLPCQCVQESLSSCVDKRLLCFFKVFPSGSIQGQSEAAALEGDPSMSLLNLRAAGSGSESDVDSYVSGDSDVLRWNRTRYGCLINVFVFVFLIYFLYILKIVLTCVRSYFGLLLSVTP